MLDFKLLETPEAIYDLTAFLIFDLKELQSRIGFCFQSKIFVCFKSIKLHYFSSTGIAVYFQRSSSRKVRNYQEILKVEKTLVHDGVRIKHSEHELKFSGDGRTYLSNAVVS